MKVALTLAAAFLTLCASCSRIATASRPQNQFSSTPRRIGIGVNYVGSGEIYFSSKQSSHQAPFDAHWDESGSTLSCAFYDPFGLTVASIMVDTAGAQIEANGKQHTLRNDDNIELTGMFAGHRFTFRELIRILTGKSPRSDAISGEPDSTWKEGKLFSALYRRDSAEIVVTKEGAGGPIRSVFHRPQGASWTVEYSQYYQEHPYRIRVSTLPAGDEFVVVFKRIRTLD